MRFRPVSTICLVCVLSWVAPAVWAQDVCEGVSEVGNTVVTSVVVVSGLQRPLLTTAPPGDTDRIFPVGQDGVIYLHRRGAAPGGHTEFLNISSLVRSPADGGGNEQGLLGVVFDPDWQDNRYFYVNYTNNFSDTVVSRWEIDAGNPDVADAGSEVVLMVIDQPESNHNGGYMEFGPDGYLYIGTGDGGGGEDEHGMCGNGQDTSTLLGKLLRIDPSEGATGDPDCASGAYTVPANPISDGPGGNCDEIWGVGLRNPWRFNFDSENGDLYVADVGQYCWEEVNYVPPGAFPRPNFGWRQKEGNHCFDHITASPSSCDPLQAPDCAPSCSDGSLIDPILEYSHAGGNCSITGGYMYRGCRMPGFRGKYFYGDYCAGTVLSFEVSGGAAINLQNWTTLVGGAFPFDLTSFGIDAQGEIYFADRDGEIRKILPPFSAMEVSGLGVVDVDQFTLNRAGNWSWEDLQFNSMHPVDFYRVYRGVPNGVFECIHSTLDTDWFAGDMTPPNPDELLAYLVTGVQSTSETSSGDPPRTLTNPCAAP